MKKQKATTQAGFTLLELIAAVVVGGILATSFFVLLSNNVARTYEPVTHTRDEANVEAVMEEIRSDFVRTINSNTYGATAMTTFTNDINSGVYNQDPANDSTTVPITVTVTTASFDAANALDTTGSDFLLVTVTAFKADGSPSHRIQSILDPDVRSDNAHPQVIY